MDADRAKALAEDWIAAWNAHDLDRILSHYAERLQYSSPLVLERLPETGGVIEDRETLRGYVRTGLTNNPALRFAFREVLIGARGFTLYYDNARGGRTAEYFECDADGKIVKVVACYSA